jgi:molecular chaperone IbpA
MLDLFVTSPYSRKRVEPSELEKQLMDTFFGTSSSSVNFPKYNVYRNMDGNPYITYMEFALAGYKKEDLDIKLEGGYLHVLGKGGADIKDREYSHRGMARRDFDVKFYIEKDVEVKSAKFSDGLLTIELEKLVPEEKKPKSIQIW